MKFYCLFCVYIEKALVLSMTFYHLLKSGKCILIKKKCWAIHMELPKVFDKISQELLTAHLHACGFSKTSLKPLFHYISLTLGKEEALIFLLFCGQIASVGT